MKFKVGDRVRVYITLIGHPVSTVGTVSYITPDGMLTVDFDRISEIVGNRGCIAHPKQCRRLVKKVMREYTIAFKGGNLWYASTSGPHKSYKLDDGTEYVRVREVPRGAE